MTFSLLFIVQQTQKKKVADSRVCIIYEEFDGEDGEMEEVKSSTPVSKYKSHIMLKASLINTYSVQHDRCAGAPLHTVVRV